jgi:hypothetical protein
MLKFFIALLCATVAAYAEPIKVPLEKYFEPNIQIRESKRNNKGHYPFISYITFRKACDIIIDDFVETFDPDSVKLGDIIYLNIWYLDWFAKEVHDRIKHPYILVTCDVGDFLPPHGAMKLLYDPKCAAWFGRNMIFSNHPKLIQIPMGQDIGLFWLEKGVEELQEAWAKKGKVEKKHLLYMNHLPRSWGDREKIVTLFEAAPFCFSRNHSDKPFAHVALSLYYDEMLSSKFILSPLGLETDCVRTWEALALGCIPVVEHTFLDPLFKDLPVLMIHNWEEIDEEFLNQKYEELKNVSATQRIYFDYWKDKIKETQRGIRNQEMQNAALEGQCFNEDDVSDLRDILKEYGSDSKGRVNLFFRGCLSVMRALQLTFEVPFLSMLCYHDVWLNRGIWDNLEYYLIDHQLLSLRNKITPISTEELFQSIFHPRNCKGAALFVDLTYYRHSLFWDLECHERLRHSLKKDIWNLFTQLNPGGLLCGNMKDDDYVKEVLSQLSQENNLSIQTRGNFWFFTVN